MGHQPSIVFAFVSICFLLSIKHYEACRSVPGEDEGVWMRNKHLLLPSLQWNPVTSPATDPGSNKAAVNPGLAGEKNFAAVKKEKRGSLKKRLLLPSLWNPVTPPAPNPGTNSDLAGEKNFAARKKSSLLLLPSLQWRPVTPPSTNPGHNLEQVEKLLLSGVPPPS